jgi:hypothetical protein
MMRRSGTGYTATLLSTLGIDCGHEAVFTSDTNVAPGDWSVSRPHLRYGVEDMDARLVG